MGKYRKRPIVIEAVQFDPTVQPWPDCIVPWRAEGPRPRDMSWGYISTLEGRMHVIAGDWIITGIKGEIYPCKDEIFRASYESMEEGKHAGQ